MLEVNKHDAITAIVLSIACFSVGIPSVILNANLAMNSTITLEKWSYVSGVSECANGGFYTIILFLSLFDAADAMFIFIVIIQVCGVLWTVLGIYLMVKDAQHTVFVLPLMQIILPHIILIFFLSMNKWTMTSSNNSVLG